MSRQVVSVPSFCSLLTIGQSCKRTVNLKIINAVKGQHDGLSINLLKFLLDLKLTR